jgi:hypothetical protein
MSTKQISASVAVWAIVAGAACCAAEGDAQRVFAPVVDALKKTVQIQIRVPMRLPNIGQGGQTVYATIEKATVDSYQIILGTEKDCDGGNYCRLGIVGGERVSEGTKLPDGGERVSLQGGITGIFFFNQCGANCPDNTMTWQQGNVRYIVGVKSGRREQLIELANAMISAH